jgi:hypothetical protein
MLVALSDDPHPAEAPSGLRLSSNAGTTRGFAVSEFQAIGCWIDRVLQDPTDTQMITHVRQEVLTLCKRYPIYGAIHAFTPQHRRIEVLFHPTSPRAVDPNAIHTYHDIPDAAAGLAVWRTTMGTAGHGCFRARRPKRCGYSWHGFRANSGGKSS